MLRKQIDDLVHFKQESFVFHAKFVSHRRMRCAARRRTLDLRRRTYVVTNSIRHLDELFSSNFVTRTPIFRSQTLEGPNFGRSILNCIDAVGFFFCDQILVGKLLTRSTNSTFFSWAKFSIFFEILKISPIFFRKNCQTFVKKVTN